jgi:hypothetical protein
VIVSQYTDHHLPEKRVRVHRPLGSATVQLVLLFHTIAHRVLCPSLWFWLQPELEARTGDIPQLFMNDPKGCFRCMNHRQSTQHSAFDKPVELNWWTCGDKVIWKGLESGILWSWAERPNHLTSALKWSTNQPGWRAADPSIRCLCCTPMGHLQGINWITRSPLKSHRFSDPHNCVSMKTLFK